MFVKNIYLIFLMIFLLSIFGGVGIAIACVFISCFIFFEKKNIILSLFFIWFLTFLNPMLVTENEFISIFKYIVILLGFIIVLFNLMLNKILCFNKKIFITFLIFLSILLHSIFFSIYPLISILKIIIWYMVFFILFEVWGSISIVERKKTIDILIDLLKIILILSVPFVFINSIGYARNESGFQGILNHPQAFGITMAIFSILLFSKILESKYINYYDLFFLVVAFIFILMSQARTAALAVAISILLGLFLNILLSKNKIIFSGLLKNTRIYPLLMLLSAIFCITVLFNVDKLNSFLFKGSDAEGLQEAAVNSRGFLVERMFNNIENNPLVGIGFGIPSEYFYTKIELDPFFGIPISVLSEKGILFIAIFEELGLLLGAVVLVWFLYLIFVSAKYYFHGLLLILCILLTNLGEYMFFSVGGMGMLLLVFFTYALQKNTKLGVS